MKQPRVIEPNQLLMQRWRELKESLEMELGHLGDDREDLFDDETSIGISVAGARELQLVNRALQRLRTGLYGFCEQCESPISKARLKAVPSATFCIKCQAANEHSKSAANTLLPEIV